MYKISGLLKICNLFKMKNNLVVIQNILKLVIPVCTTIAKHIIVSVAFFHTVHYYQYAYMKL